MSVIFRLLVLTFVLVAIATMTSERVVRAQPGNPLVGTWALVSTIKTLADGTTRADPQVGLTPKGYMIYGDAGRMCAQFTNPARPQWKSPTTPTYEELRSTIDFMGAYCSRYEVCRRELCAAPCRDRSGSQFQQSGTPPEL